MSFVNSTVINVDTCFSIEATTSAYNSSARRIDFTSIHSLQQTKGHIIKIKTPIKANLIFNTALTNFELYIYNYNGTKAIDNPITNATYLPSTDYTILTNMQSDQEYIFTLVPTAAVPNNTYLFSLGFELIPTIEDYFENGYEINPNLPSSIIAVQQQNGSLLFQFINVIVAIGDNILLAALNNAKQAGTIQITSSDSTTFPSITQSFNPMNSVFIVANALRNTTFTGTILVNLTNVGVGFETAVVPQFTTKNN